MHKKQDGYIVVETTVAFMLFTLLVVSILSLINIVVIQTRVHYALTQTATELSMYSYVLDAMGLTKDIKSLDKTAGEVQETIDGVVSDLNKIEQGLTVPGSTAEFFSNLDTVFDAVGSLASAGQEIAENPKETFINVVRWGLDSGKNFMMQEYVMRPMLYKYLENGDQSGEEFLAGYGVKGEISLADSVFIDSKGDITIVASYDIDYTFGLLPLPPGLTEIHVEQTAKTRAWLGGAGDG